MIFMNSNIRPDIYELLDTLSIEGKEELLEYIGEIVENEQVE